MSSCSRSKRSCTRGSDVYAAARVHCVTGARVMPRADCDRGMLCDRCTPIVVHMRSLVQPVHAPV